MRFKSTPIGYSVHLEKDNAIYGETAVHVTVVDESAGPFLRLEGLSDCREEGVIQIDYEQLEEILVVARKLIEANQND